MINNYNDPEIEEGFKLWYGNNNRYPVSNAYNEPEFYRSVKRDFDAFSNALATQFPKSELSEYKVASGKLEPPQPNTSWGSDMQSSKNNAFSPDDPWLELKTFIRNAEDVILHPYLDKFGGKTECDGNLDETYEEFASHPWIDTSTKISATPEQIRQGWLKIEKQPLNHRAGFYKDKTNLELAPEYCNALLDRNIKMRDAELKRGFPNYSKMSQNMKNALHDVHFTSNVLRFKKAKAAAQRMDKDALCRELHRDESTRADMKKRNDWVLKQCLKGEFLK